MARTVLASPNKFTPRSVTKVYILKGTVTDAATHAPTRAELEAATTYDVTKGIADMSGFSLTYSDIETPYLGSGFTSVIPGRATAEASSLTFYADITGIAASDVRSWLNPLDNIHVVFLDGGDVPTNLARVYPCQVKNITILSGGVTGEAANRIVVGLSITDTPNEKYVIPAIP